MAVEFQSGVHGEELVDSAPVVFTSGAYDRLVLHGIAKGYALIVVEHNLAVCLILEEIVEAHADGDVHVGVVLRHVIFDDVVGGNLLLELHRDVGSGDRGVAVAPLHYLVVASGENQGESCYR